MTTMSRIARCGWVLLMTSLIASGAKATDLDRGKLTAQLIKHEGKRSKVYNDTQGHPTIGVGFNLDRNDAKARIEALGLDYAQVKAGTQELSEPNIMSLLSDDMDTAIAGCQAVFPHFADLSDVRQRVLADMIFNLGKAKFAGFTKLIAAVNSADFTQAAAEMKNSAWYRQVGTRGKTLVAMMQTDMDPS